MINKYALYPPFFNLHVSIHVFITPSANFLIHNDRSHRHDAYSFRTNAKERSDCLNSNVGEDVFEYLSAPVFSESIELSMVFSSSYNAA